MGDEYFKDQGLIGAVDAGEFDAKGDLLVGTADNTFDNLPVGTAGELLIPLSTETTGLEWFSVGSNGDFLVPNSAATRGLEWVSIVTYEDEVVSSGGAVVYN